MCAGKSRLSARFREILGSLSLWLLLLLRLVRATNCAAIRGSPRTKIKMFTQAGRASLGRRARSKRIFITCCWLQLTWCYHYVIIAAIHNTSLACQCGLLVVGERYCRIMDDRAARRRGSVFEEERNRRIARWLFSPV